MTSVLCHYVHCILYRGHGNLRDTQFRECLILVQRRDNQLLMKHIQRF